MAKVRMYTTRVCPYCIQAKALLKRNGVEFEEIDLTGKDDERAALVAQTHHRTVPQIFVGDLFVGGYTDLVAKIESGELTFESMK